MAMIQVEPEERWEQEWREYEEKVVKEQREYCAIWPNHCKSCGGRGVHTWTEYHDGPKYPGEHMAEPCDSCTYSTAEGPQKCPRCAELGLWEDGSGPCSFCGWDYPDGGIPEF